MSSIVLNWSNRVSAASVVIYRSTAPFDLTSLPVPLATVAMPATSYTDSASLVDQTVYYYAMRTQSAAGGLSALSPLVSVKYLSGVAPPPPPPPPPTLTFVNSTTISSATNSATVDLSGEAAGAKDYLVVVSGQFGSQFVLVSSTDTALNRTFSSWFNGFDTVSISHMNIDPSLLTLGLLHVTVAPKTGSIYEWNVAVYRLANANKYAVDTFAANYAANSTNTPTLTTTNDNSIILGAATDDDSDGLGFGFTAGMDATLLAPTNIGSTFYALASKKAVTTAGSTPFTYVAGSAARNNTALVSFRETITFTGLPAGHYLAPLFANGEDGFVFDPALTSTLWQDAAKTLPVTASGQSVAVWDDARGSGRSITFPSTTKPTWHDGTTDGFVNATPYLNFTGVEYGIYRQNDFSFPRPALFMRVESRTTSTCPIFWQAAVGSNVSPYYYLGFYNRSNKVESRWNGTAYVTTNTHFGVGYYPMLCADPKNGQILVDGTADYSNAGVATEIWYPPGVGFILGANGGYAQNLVGKVFGIALIDRPATASDHTAAVSWNNPNQYYAPSSQLYVGTARALLVMGTQQNALAVRKSREFVVVGTNPSALSARTSRAYFIVKP